MSKNIDPEKIVREIKRKTRRKFSAEEKIRIVLDGLRGEETIAELCRREGISPNLYYNWSKELLEAGLVLGLGHSPATHLTHPPFCDNFFSLARGIIQGRTNGELNGLKQGCYA